MRSNHWRLLAVLFLAGVVGCGGKKDADSDSGGGAAGDKAWKKPFDTTFVTPDCFAAIIVHPQRIAQAPALAGSAEMAELEKSEGFKEVVGDIGFDPRDLEQVAFLMIPPAGTERGGDEPGVAAILRWAKPVDGKALLQKWNKDSDLREDKHSGKTYFTRVPKNEVLRKFASREAFYLPDDRTMVICPFEKQLQAVLDSGGKKGPMSEYLRGVDLDRDGVAAFVAEPAKSLMEPLAQEMARSAPPGLSELGKFPGYVKSATLSVNLFDAEMLKLVVEGTNADAATSLHNIAKALHGMLKQMYPQVREEMSKAPGGLPEDVKKTVLNLADQAVEGLRVAKSGDIVDISLRMKDAQAGVKLLPMLVRAISDAREAARSSMRMFKLHQLSRAMQTALQAKNQFPAAASRVPNGKPLLSWRVQLLPYLDGGEVYKELHLDEPWDSEHNKKLIAKIPDVFRSDSKDGVPEGHTTVMVFAGEGTPFGLEKGATPGQITDGLSNTIMLVDAGPDKAVPWTKPQDLPFDPVNSIAALGRISDRGFIVALFDGSVRRLPRNIPAATLKALITHAGGETVDWSSINGPPRSGPGPSR
jgi:hypothetical protein